MYDTDIGYSIRDKNNEFRYKRFIGSLDYSLDLIKLREVYKKVYRRSDFSVKTKNKEYTNRVVNVTFNYSIKEYNKYGKNLYVKIGHNPNEIKLKDSVCIKDKELIAIEVGKYVKNTRNIQDLCEYFKLEDGMYKELSIPTIYTVADIRRKLYCEGFRYDGIDFVRYKRSAGSSRVGKCLFIDKNLYKRMHKWELCGLNIKEGDEVDLAALESYISLTLSSIIDTITIKPENILLIDDYNSIFKETVMATEYVSEGVSNLSTLPKEVEISNSIWDGQALLDTSMFGKYSKYGCLLLRHRFFKSCAFNCNLQEFFKDNGITSVEQLNGKTIAKNIEDIKLITTPSSVKYLKFGTWEDWLSNLNSDFGIVKHEKPTNYFNGSMVATHYQLLNTLQMKRSEVEEFIKPTLDFLELLHTKPSVLRHYIQYRYKPIKSEPLKSKNDIVYTLLGINPQFAQTKLYWDFKRDMTKAFTKKARHGKILVNGNYSVMCGNPYEMLLSSIGKFNGETTMGVGNIYTKRFEFDKKILGSRSPHVCSGNIWITTNKYNPMIDRYMNLSKEIVCVNSINENLLERLSGSDFDSDSVLLTDNELLIEVAKRNYDKFLTPTKLVEGVKVKRRYTDNDKADLDIKTSVNKIGEIVNLSQELNSIMWDNKNKGVGNDEFLCQIYKDISQLDVMSNLEIDAAKKELPIDNVKELELIRNKYDMKADDGRNIKPNFFSYIARGKGYYDNKKNEYRMHETTMDYLQCQINKFRLPRQSIEFKNFSDLFETVDGARVNMKQIEKVFRVVKECKLNIDSVWASLYLSNQEKHLLSNQIKEETIELIENIRFNQNTMIKLLKLVEMKENKDIGKTIVSLLFSMPNESFFNALRVSSRRIPLLKEAEDGEIKIYDFKFTEN